MDRKSKIIVSVVGIFIVLLALVGITYAYFLTQVQGNTNDTSISITTANLRLVYNDGTGAIEAENIQPGDTVYTKTFTVTNEGNATIDYEVYLENVINNFVHEEDLLMFVTCESNIVGNTCNGYGEGSVSNNTPTFGDSIYPTVNSKLIENSIEPASTGVDAEVHTYTLYLKFKDDDSDQSIDMGKTLQGKIQIYDPKDVVAIIGTVTGYDSSYYVELKNNKTNEIKTSEITTDGSYIFYGVGAEEHILSLKYTSNGNENVAASKVITITKENTESITADASSIVINDSSEEAIIDFTYNSDSETYTTVGKNIYGDVVVTNYTLSEIAASNNLFAIGGPTYDWTEENFSSCSVYFHHDFSDSVVASVDIDSNQLNITRNGANSDGLMGNVVASAGACEDFNPITSSDFYYVNIENGVYNIGNAMFQYMSNVDTVNIPKSVTSIGEFAFDNCSELTSIYYEGTMAEWNKIEKGISWDSNTGNYVIYCSDGNISKSS